MPVCAEAPPSAKPVILSLRTVADFATGSRACRLATVTSYQWLRADQAKEPATRDSSTSPVYSTSKACFHVPIALRSACMRVAVRTRLAVGSKARSLRSSTAASGKEEGCGDKEDEATCSAQAVMSSRVSNPAALGLEPDAAWSVSPGAGLRGGAEGTGGGAGAPGVARPESTAPAVGATPSSPACASEADGIVPSCAACARAVEAATAPGEDEDVMSPPVGVGGRPKLTGWKRTPASARRRGEGPEALVEGMPAESAAAGGGGGGETATGLSGTALANCPCPCACPWMEGGDASP